MISSASVSTLRAALRVVDDDREFIAAHAADRAVRTNLVDQAFGDGAKDRVPLGVAERVVDRFEPVEIEEHDGAGRIAASCAAERLAKQLADPAPIGEPGKHVDVGEMGQAFLGLANFGDVRTNAAETLRNGRRCR